MAYQEKLFAADITDKELISLIHKELLDRNKKNISILTEIYTKYISRQFIEKKIQISLDIGKVFSSTHSKKNAN